MNRPTLARTIACLWKLPVEGTPEPSGSGFPDLATMQGYVGGFIEHVQVSWHRDEAHLFVNEDGLRFKLPVNPFASAIYQIHFGIETPPFPELAHILVPEGSVIVGNALLWLGPLPASETQA